VRLCLMIEGQEDVTWDQWVALARACEEHGLEGLFRSDHYLSVFDRSGRGSLDAWTSLAGLAAITSRIRLGTLVSPATFRHPSVLAKSVTTVDHISGGRVELGLGAGWHEREHRAYGFPFPDQGTRLDLLEEQIEVIHRLWSDDRVKFEDHHYRLDDVRPLPMPVQQPHPPLIVGGHAGPRSVALAARWADEYNVNDRTPEECRDLRARVATAWEREGRDRDTLVFSVMTGVVVGRDRDELETAAERTGSPVDPPERRIRGWNGGSGGLPAPRVRVGWSGPDDAPASRPRRSGHGGAPRQRGRPRRGLIGGRHRGR
jgi:F420-dependent oxidoreductase-like protein